jgi:hypothetical protein
MKRITNIVLGMLQIVKAVSIVAIAAPIDQMKEKIYSVLRTPVPYLVDWTLDARGTRASEPSVT